MDGATWTMFLVWWVMAVDLSLLPGSHSPILKRG